MREAVDDPKSRRRGDGGRFADRAREVADLARVRRAQLEAERRIDAHGVKQLAADELDARDERLGRLDVLLDQRHAVDRGLERVAVDVALERGDVIEQPYAEALARAVVLGDERAVHRARGLHDRVAADGGNGSRHADAIARERRVLRHLADLELQRATAVDHAAAVRFQPRQHAAGQFRRVAMAARVRRSAHPVVEHARWRRRGKIERAVVDEPFVERQPRLVERGAQRLDPGVVFMDDINTGHGGS